MKNNFTRIEVLKLMEYLDNRRDDEIFDTYQEELDDYLNEIEVKKLTIPVVCSTFKEKNINSIVGFENYIAKVHPDPDSVIIDNLKRWEQIVLLAENYANQKP